MAARATPLAEMLILLSTVLIAFDAMLVSSSTVLIVFSAMLVSSSTVLIVFSAMLVSSSTVLIVFSAIPMWPNAMLIALSAMPIVSSGPSEVASPMLHASGAKTKDATQARFAMAATEGPSGAIGHRAGIMRNALGALPVALFRR
jgi:hypothetical protein